MQTLQRESLRQMAQILAPPKMELSLSGACLDLLVAPGACTSAASQNASGEFPMTLTGDVLLMRGSGRLAEIGNAGGFMGHVLVVCLGVNMVPTSSRHGSYVPVGRSVHPRTGKPREVLATSPDARQLASLWPEQAAFRLC